MNVATGEASAPTSPPAPRRRPGLWPREHGAYVQLVAPLLTVLAFRGFGRVEWCLALSAVALFLAHEPALVLLGVRGRRQARELRRPALSRLVAFAVLGLLGGGLALWFARVGARWAMLPPGALALVAVLLVFRGQERSLAGELCVGTALASLAAPLLLQNGVALGVVLWWVGAWAACHALGVLVARAVVYRKHDDGRGLRVLRWLVPMLSVAGAGAWVSGVGPWYFWLAPVPYAALALWVVTGRWVPRRPAQLGWALVASTLGAVAVLGLALIA